MTNADNTPEKPIPLDQQIEEYRRIHERFKAMCKEVNAELSTEDDHADLIDEFASAYADLSERLRAIHNSDDSAEIPDDPDEMCRHYGVTPIDIKRHSRGEG